MAEPVVTIDLEFVMGSDIRLNVSMVGGRDTLEDLPDQIVVTIREDPDQTESIHVMRQHLLCMRMTRRVLEP